MPTEWETFYLMVGSSAVILIGLLFVVITLSSNMEARRAVIGARIYMTPTVYHLGTVVLVSAVALMPGMQLYAMALVVAVPALSGFVYAALSLLRMFRNPPVPHWTDYVYYGVVPGVVHLWLMAAAWAFWQASESAAYAVAAGLVALLLIGIRDAWDLATYLVHQPRADR
jgi:hypothetical protein